MTAENMVDKSSMKKRKYEIGDRIECCGHFGTIKYIGPVDGQPSIWLGIDWDDAKRGKHDGSVNGVRYFVTKHEQSGSFVRPEKLEFGRSIVDAIVARYGYIDDDFSSKLNQQKQLKFQQDINAPFVEMVGFDKVHNKQSNFTSLTIINLHLQNVSSCGELFELNRICPNIQELDISKNLLSSWHDIFEICDQLERLHWLNVSDNRLDLPVNYKDYTFPNIKTLICNLMDLDWCSIKKIIHIFPNLEDFRAHHNNITKIFLDEGDFHCLKVIDLEGNRIRSWEEICRLGEVKNLEQLFIENIGLERIEFPEIDEPIPIFMNLKKMLLSNNLISDWQSIGELNKLASLEELQILKNPILDPKNTTLNRQLIIARIANLKILNREFIEAGERRGAEYDYLKLHGSQWAEVKSTSNESIFLKAHNRYLELIKKYGELEDSKGTQETKISDVLVSVQLVCGDKVITKKLPPTLTVQRLIVLVKKLFKLDTKPQLTYTSSKYSDVKFDLTDELKEVGLYSMQDGDQIHVTI